MPEISVIVPVYRAEAFLHKCVESILSQSFSDLELLLVDDGSPDYSGALCDAFAQKDLRVRALHKENGGVSSARNLGMKEAKGRYIAFADADDWLPPDSLDHMYQAMKDAGGDSAGGSHDRVELDGRQEREPGAMPAGVYGPEEFQAGILDRLMGQRMGKPGEVLNGFIWRFLFSRSIIVEHNITFSGSYLEDELFLLEYFCHAHCLAMIDEPVYCYLQNPDSVTRRYLPNYVQTFTQFMQAKEKLAARYGLDKRQPLWRENSNWSGLLIAIGNEFAPGNPASLREKRRNIQAMCQQPDMAKAIAAIRPEGLGRNKQMVADLICSKHFLLLSLLYWFKNRNK